jgi:hypothetical protein
MKNFFLIFGGNVLNRGVSEKFAKNLILVVDPRDTPDIDYDFHLQFDVRNFKEILNYLKTNSFDKDNFRGGYTSLDIAIESLSKIYSYYGFVYGGDKLLKFQTKSSMTSCWHREGLLQRISLKLSKVNDVPLNLKGKNIIIKPNQSSSSRGISIISSDNLDDYAAAISKACETSFDDLAVIEEFISGTEFTIEMLVDSEGISHAYAVSKKYHTNNVIGNKIAVKLHYNPIDESDDELIRIADFGKLCLDSFGLRCCFGHLEMVRDFKGDLHPIEIGFRSSGFIASHLVDYTSERDYINDLINNIIYNTKIDYDLHISDKSSMYFFYDLKPGFYVKDASKTLLSFLPSSIRTIYSDVNNIYSNPVKSITSDNERHGVEILLGSRLDLTIEKVQIAEKKIYEYEN